MMETTPVPANGNGHHPDLNGQPPARPRGIGRLFDYGVIFRTPYGAVPLAVLIALNLVGIFENQILAVALPNIQSDLHLRLQTVVQIAVSAGLVITVVGVWIGWWADRNRRVPMLVFGSVVQAIFGIFSARSTSASQFNYGYAGDGAFNQVAAIPRLPLLADWYPPEVRGRIFSLDGAVYSTGALLATFGVGGLILLYGWRTVWIACAGLLILVGLSALLLKEPIRGYWERRAAGLSEEQARIQDEPLSFGESMRTTFAIRTFRRVFLSYFVQGIGSGAFNFFLIYMLADVYGLNVFERGVILIPRVVGLIVGSIISGALIDYFSARTPASVLRLAGVFGVVAALGNVIVALALPLPIFIAFTTFAGFGQSLIRPASTAILVGVIPARVRTMALQFLNLSDLGSYITFTFFFIMLQDFGYTPMMLTTSAFVILGAILFVSSADFVEGDMRAQLVSARATELWKRDRQAGGAKLVTATQVDVHYGAVQVLFGVDFELDDGEIVALLGTNGAGKSTLLKAISGVQEASGGAILYEGRDITHMPPDEIAKRGIIHMPGGRGTFPGLTVRDNLELGTWMTSDRNEAKRRLAKVYEIFPVLKARGGEPAAALSGGEQQMLSLAQAFLSNPRVLLIDELSLGLAPAIVGQLLDIVRAMNDEGTAVVLVEQSVNVALTVAKRAVFLEKGEVKFSGPTADLLRRPDILRAIYVKGTSGGTGGDSIINAAARRRREAELSAANTILRVADVHKSFGGVTALDGVSLDLREGEILGLIGPNGSGKTTLLDVISGYVRPDSGRILLEDADITNLAPSERAKRRLVRRFQDARLYPSLTVYETLLVALDRRLEVRNPLLAAAGLPQAMRAERRARIRADRLLEVLSIQAYRDKFVSELSTGLRRIVDLAVVLAGEPRVLLLDEPSTGIAQAESEGLAPLVRRVRHETGCAILIIEHDIPLITALADELIVLDRGRLLARGAAEEVLSDPHVTEAYLGTDEAAIQRSGALVS
jgi:ABC-type branched-subunit amino acid transport system ATPase component/sugar phosphate permease